MQKRTADSQEILRNEDDLGLRSLYRNHSSADWYLLNSLRRDELALLCRLEEERRRIVPIPLSGEDIKWAR